MSSARRATSHTSPSFHPGSVVRFGGTNDFASRRPVRGRSLPGLGSHRTGSKAGTRARDLLRRDVDMCEELWPSRIGAVKVQFLGPWSMATAMEMSNGHRVLSDAGAVRDVAEALTAGVIAHARDVQRRFSADTVVVQVDEPHLDAVRRGGIEGTSDFDTLPPVHIDELQKILFPFYEACADQGFTTMINQRGYAPLWDLVPAGGALIDVATITSSRDLDAAGVALESRFSGENRCAVSTDRVNLERVCSELGQDRGIFDVYAIGVPRSTPRRTSWTGLSTSFPHHRPVGTPVIYPGVLKCH